MATLFVGVLIMTRIDSDAWQEWFLVSTLSMVVALNICTAIYQGGLIGGTTQEIEFDNNLSFHTCENVKIQAPQGKHCSGVCGKFPPSYMGGMMAGQALGGIFPALVNIFVIAMQVDSSDYFCHLFFQTWQFCLEDSKNHLTKVYYPR